LRDAWRRSIRRSWSTEFPRPLALSPRLVMERGYCLVRGQDGRLLRAAAGLSVGDPITVEFARGEAAARIEQVRTGDEHGQ